MFPERERNEDSPYAISPNRPENMNLFLEALALVIHGDGDNNKPPSIEDISEAHTTMACLLQIGNELADARKRGLISHEAAENIAQMIGEVVPADWEEFYREVVGIFSEPKIDPSKVVLWWKRDGNRFSG